MSVLDRFLQSVAPRAALRRAVAREKLAILGAWQGASRTRVAMRGWNPQARSAADDTLDDLPLIRARSRDLVRNAPLAGGAINTVVTQVVGTGLTKAPKVRREVLGWTEDQARAWQERACAEWELFCGSTKCDVTNHQNFYGLQALALRSALESGDVVSILASVQRPQWPYRLAVQMIEADLVSNPKFAPDKPGLMGGIELTSGGEAVAVHVASGYPGLLSGTLSWSRIPMVGANSGRRNVIHFFERRRPTQVRGVPYLAAVIEPLMQLKRYSEAELQAAVVSGAFAVFVKMDPEAFERLFDDKSKGTLIEDAHAWDGSVSGTMDGPGNAINLLPGESIESATATRPNALFDPFVQAVLRQIGANLEVPFEVLIKHFSSSYSAARAALLDAWRFFRARRDWMTTHFCQPIYETWLEEAVSIGRISAPGFFSDPLVRAAYCGGAWTGDGPGSIDPVKEIEAATKRVALGTSTREAESILHDGVSWEEKHAQLVVEENARRRDGLQGSTEPAQSTPQNETQDVIDSVQQT